jgi:hypothetical protein
MKHIRNLAFVAALLVLLAACSTMLSVKAPEKMYVSTGDYVEGVKTEGIIQVHQLTWTPLVVLYDASKVRESLYKQLLDKAKGSGGVDGITNISFYQKPSVYSLLAPVTLGLGIWVDNYAEGVVISTRK